jgi:pilus assembly protein Flp/PilA
MLLIRRFIREAGGATAIEYALIASLISIGIIVGVAGIGTATAAKFSSFVAVFH